MAKAPKVTIIDYDPYTEIMRYTIGNYEYTAAKIPPGFHGQVKLHIGKKKYGDAIKLLQSIPENQVRSLNPEAGMKDLVDQATDYAMNQFCANSAMSPTEEQKREMDYWWEGVPKAHKGYVYGLFMHRKPEWTSSSSGRVQVKIVDMFTGKEYEREADIMFIGAEARVHFTFGGRMRDIPELLKMKKPVDAPEYEMHVRNPLTTEEFYKRIALVEAHRDKARALLKAGKPHLAEEEAYQGLGILQNIEEEAKLILGIHGEKRQIVQTLRGTLNKMIGHADEKQGRPIPNPKYNFARRHYQLIAEALNEAGHTFTNLHARSSLTFLAGYFSTAFAKDNPRFNVTRFLSVIEWLLPAEKDSITARLRQSNPKYKFAKRHYELISKGINEAGNTFTNYHSRSSLLYVAIYLSSRFKKDNPRFNVVRFLNAIKWLSPSERDAAISKLSHAQNPAKTSHPIALRWTDDRGFKNTMIFAYNFIGWDKPSWETTKYWYHPHYKVDVTYNEKTQSFDYWGTYKDYTHGKNYMTEIEFAEAIVTLLQTVLGGQISQRDFAFEFDYPTVNSAKKPWTFAKRYAVKWRKLQAPGVLDIRDKIKDSYDL